MNTMMIRRAQRRSMPTVCVFIIVLHDPVQILIFQPVLQQRGSSHSSKAWALLPMTAQHRQS